MGSIKKQPGSVNFQNSLTIKDLCLDVSCYFWLLWRSKYNSCNLKDSRVIIQANLDLLQILKAYDELKQLGHLEKSKHTIKAAQSLSKWLLENERENSMIALHQLNSLQITKRQRAFTEDEINLLLQLSQNNSDMVRAGAFLLLGKIDVAQFIIQQFPEDEKTRFMEFPIAIFIKGTNC